MGKGFKCGGSGAGVNLQIAAFATLDALEAAAARDGTIGIVTDTAVTRWQIGGEQPTDAEAGMLWIRTGAASPGAFSCMASTGNALMICPEKAYQHTGSGWVERPGRTRLEGSWKSWAPDAVYLFRNGDQNIDVTGGWSGIDPAAEKIQVSYSAESDDWASISCGTGKAVDVSRFGRLLVTVDAYNEQFTVSLMDGSGNKRYSARAEAPGMVEMSLVNVDDGAYTIVLESVSAPHGGSVGTGFTVSEVKLEVTA